MPIRVIAARPRPGPPPASGATAGKPGTYTPLGAVIPANRAALAGVVASPQSAWAVGQYIVTADGAESYWSSTAWVAGRAPQGATGAIIYGSSIGNGVSVATMVNALAPKMIRTYDQPGEVFSSWGACNGGKSGLAGYAIAHSVKPDMDVISNASSGGYAAMIASFKLMWAGMPDIPGQSSTLWHEPIDNTSFTAAQWIQAQVNWKRDVIDPVNVGRTHKIAHATNIQGLTVTDGRLDTWYTATVRNTVDWLTIDTYNENQLIPYSNWMTANAPNKKWGIFETGYRVGVNHTDDVILAYMQLIVNTYYPQLTNKPYCVLWFNGAFNNITNGSPKSTAYWKALCQASPSP
jgi:hypothetical protein